MFVIMTEDRRCVVKGKSRKHLCSLQEDTRKELVAYDSRAKAQSALMRFCLLKSAQVNEMYPDSLPRLEIVEQPDGSL